MASISLQSGTTMNEVELVKRLVPLFLVRCFTRRPSDRVKGEGYDNEISLPLLL